MKREYHRWFSPRLRREMELLVFGHAGMPVLTFPTRQGRFFDYENWGLVGALADRIDAGWLRLYCVDSADSEALYCRCRPPRARIERHVQYEGYVLEEVLPLMHLENPHACRPAAHGCSIGAYHAVNIAFRHPDRFGRVIGLSGRYDLTQRIGGFPDLFDGYYDEDIYFQTPSHYIPGLSDPVLLDQLRRLDITLAVGDADPFCPNVQHLSGCLRDKHVPHSLHLWRGEAHRARDWREMVRCYL
jgi:esterase/lipase superfamily enzyme